MGICERERLTIERNNNPINQHYVPQVYLRNFCGTNGSIAVLNKNTRKIFSTGTAGVGFEKNFYTLNKHQAPYCWENFYAKKIESLMETLLSKIISKASIVVRNGYHIIDEEEKIKLVYIMVMQLFCGKQSRKYKEALFKKLLPDVFEKVKKFWTIKLTASGIVG